MDLSSLRPAKGAVKNKKRVGRGQGSGNGTTAGKGNKGQQARSGYKRPINEGGQIPVYRRLPKFGFTPIDRKSVTTVNLSQITRWIEQGLIENELGVIELKVLCHASNADYFKVLGNGEITAAVKITAHGFSKSAEAKITAAGGEAVTAVRTLEEAARVRDLAVEEALLKPKTKLVKRVKKNQKP
ncbi:50S ribosomal protein L15 [Pelodictyon luteolum]|uniref:Large ribosomal subunit protein uL15 n=1 Tax=Chlorobium luteolum (strain DSM 273 / BCRC 81028 / 2530) TaxID=319225 RepID=RL15_CHLL3|nr:50S ribosomal protein L15 [Pelodictyon luteolum]Q3B6E3.1 RecName: Full=Large ribosomal subunit protein uL15; AltName: Full=50S ribosomal protein L15 [Pelodictyon luteolum DSM 273]ABB23088.1 LSU ribosomal protein L15P [Pelodictyon luteolum DSM 273]